MFHPIRTPLVCALLMLLSPLTTTAAERASLFLTEASNDAPQVVADGWLRASGAQYFGLEATDLEFALGEDSYQSTHNKVSHLFFNQFVKGVPVYRGLIQVNVMADGRVLNANSSFVPNALSRANSPTPQLTASDAVRAAARDLGVSGFAPLAKPAQPGSDGRATFAGGVLSAEDIRTRLVYEPHAGELRLAWQFVLDRFERDGKLLDVRYDAATGELLASDDYVEQFDSKHPEHAGDAVKAAGYNTEYRVSPLGQESPGHPGVGHALVTNPHVDNASPLGWHETRSSPPAGQPEYLVTRGSNVRAQWDLLATNINNDSARPLGVWDAGANTLRFDFPWDPNDAPDSVGNRIAATVNLFYWNNIIHDVMYQYGFDEVAGNFQFNNYGRGGAQNDGVIADALDGSMATPPSTDNANFSTPVDGGSGRMQMFRWVSPGGLEITAPYTATYTSAVPGDWGGAYTTVPPSQIVPVNAPTTGAAGCEGPYLNAGEVSGKIALVKRGTCEFGLKGLIAQQNGAIGVIVYNNGGAPGGMAPGVNGPSVTIPVMGLLDTADGDAIALAAASGTVIGEMKRKLYADRDSDFDAGIMAHEYGHGISYRLTGGPSTSCLGGDEQQGEGWSDFFGLMLTMTDDVCDVPRGIGTYSGFDTPDGPGIRRYPYTPDMNINPFTFADVADTAQSVPHGVGSVWATMLWDMSCKLMDRYGYDSDVYNRGGGNGMALQLVVDGEKLQGCFPQFVKSRDAILAADTALAAVPATDYLTNRCIIWQSFARRGVGKNASSGTYTSRSDQTEDFTVPAECVSFTVNATAGVGGTLSPPGSQTPAYEAVLTFTAAPNPGYVLQSVSGCEGTLTGPTFVTKPIVRNCTVTATFAPDPLNFIFADGFE